jgi:hypothetical protein
MADNDGTSALSSGTIIIAMKAFVTCYLLALLLLSLADPSLASKNDKVHQSQQLASRHVVEDWIQARCGPNNNNNNNNNNNIDGSNNKEALWVYEGALYDPLEGKLIANVQGLEIVSKISECHNSKPTSHFLKQCRHLIAGSLLNNPVASFDYASTIWSRKVFCYSPSNSKGLTLLRSIRLRPKSPLKIIPTEQAVVLYETATTCIARKDDELVVLSEWPDGKSLWGTTTLRHDDDNDNTLDYTVYTKHRSQKLNQLPDLTTPPKSSSLNNSTTETTVSPKRSALIQFGKSTMEEQHRFGARETYSYTIPKNRETTNPRQNKGWWPPTKILQAVIGASPKDKTATTTTPSCQVRYTRYGEGPPFYSPGRMCTLELRGRRLASLEEAPPLIAALVRDRIPSFFQNLPSSIPTDNGIFLFPPPSSSSSGSSSSSALRVLPDPHEPPRSWRDTKQAQLESIFYRVKSATKLQSLPPSSLPT